MQSGSSFDHFAQFMEELEPVERYSQTECLLARRSLSPLQLLCDFARGGLFRASVFKVRTSSVVHERRFPFFMIYLSVVKRGAYCETGGLSIFGSTKQSAQRFQVIARTY